MLEKKKLEKNYTVEQKQQKKLSSYVRMRHLKGMNISKMSQFLNNFSKLFNNSISKSGHETDRQK